MVWKVYISFYVWQNDTQSTIDRHCILPLLCTEYDTFFLPTDIRHTVRWHASFNKRVCYNCISININASLIQRWPAMLTWMRIYQQSILDKNIMCEPTKTTSLLALQSFVRRAEVSCWSKIIWIIYPKNGTGYSFECTCSLNILLNAKKKLLIAVDYIRSCHTIILLF